MLKNLAVTRAGSTTRLTLNRPDKANSLSPDLVEELLEALESATSDGSRLVVLAGEGKHFCSGFDFADLDQLSNGDLVYRIIRIETLLQAVYHLPIPTLVLAHGKIFGAGADLVLSCSQRIAHPQSLFRMPGLGFGLVLGTRRLAACIGKDQARNIQNAGRSFDAEEALRIQFVNQLADQTQWPSLVKEASEAAEKLPLESTHALFRVTNTDHRAEDMAELVWSASRPGFKERLSAYRDLALK